MHRAVLALFLAVATPAGAVDLPAPPAMDAPARDRFYLASEEAGELSLLAARIECVAHHRARIEGFAGAGGLAWGWSSEAERLWRLSRALDLFEAAHIRPHVDPDTQEALAATYAERKATDAEDRARRCLSFADPIALRCLAG